MSEPGEAKAKRSWTRTPPPEHTPSTREWVEIARRTLIAEGVAQVKVERLARAAGVTRGGFYWRFKSRDALLDALLDDWRTTNTDPLLDILRAPGEPLQRLRELARMQIAEEGFSAGYDTAVRAWAGSSAKVAAVVREVDDLRLEAMTALFLDAGYGREEAVIRARITYLHQVGYYAVGLREPRDRRRTLTDLYLKVLTGLD